jgi:hypothetical protein
MVLLTDKEIQSWSGQSYLLSFRPAYELPSSHVSTANGRATDGPEHYSRWAARYNLQE